MGVLVTYRHVTEPVGTEFDLEVPYHIICLVTKDLSDCRRSLEALEETSERE